MKYREKTKLEDFSLSQLNILLKHLRLGPDHLKLILTPKQLHDFFNWPDLKSQKEEISADKIEKLGNMSLIINTILTSTFGAWMGLSGCLGCGLGSFKMLLFISILAFFVSGLTGYMSLKTTQHQANDAIFNHAISQFELHVLKVINQKIEERQKAVSFYLHTAVVILANSKEEFAERRNNLFKNMSDAYEWYENLMNVLKARLETSDEKTIDIYENQTQRISFLLKKTIAKYFSILENIAHANQNKERRLQIMPTLPFLKILTNYSTGFSKYREQKSSSGIKSPAKSQLFIGIIPTIWGGFASMFVFVGGIPNIARELDFVGLASVLTTPLARTVEITLAGFITCYFAFAFLYSYRKSWQRQRVLAEIEKDIAYQEAQLLENNHNLDMLHKVKMYVQKLISVFTVVKKIDQSS